MPPSYSRDDIKTKDAIKVLCHFNYEMHPVRIRTKLPYTGPGETIRLNDFDDPGDQDGRSI